MHSSALKLNVANESLKSGQVLYSLGTTIPRADTVYAWRIIAVHYETTVHSIREGACGSIDDRDGKLSACTNDNGDRITCMCCSGD